MKPGWGDANPTGGHSLANRASRDERCPRHTPCCGPVVTGQPAPGNLERRQTCVFLLPSCLVFQLTSTNTLPFSAKGANY